MIAALAGFFLVLIGWLGYSSIRSYARLEVFRLAWVRIADDVFKGDPEYVMNRQDISQWFCLLMNHFSTLIVMMPRKSGGVELLIMTKVIRQWLIFRGVPVEIVRLEIMDANRKFFKKTNWFSQLAHCLCNISDSVSHGYIDNLLLYECLEVLIWAQLCLHRSNQLKH